MGRTESLNLKNDYERACGWYGHFNKSEMALFSECTDRYAQKLLDTADIVREAMLRQLSAWASPRRTCYLKLTVIRSTSTWIREACSARTPTMPS
jgi:hypothetical protein